MTALYTFRFTVCDACVAGKGPECWTPGCAFWACDVPSDEVAGRLLLAFTNDDEAIEETA